MTKMCEKIVTEIAITPVLPDKSLIAFCSFLLFGKFKVNSVGIHVRQDGRLRLVYPDMQMFNGKRACIVYPIYADVGAKIEKEVEIEYQKVMKEDGKSTERKRTY